MNWQYIIGSAIIVVLLFMAFYAGHLHGHGQGYRRGHSEGFDDGQAHAKDRYVEELKEANPWTERLRRANRIARPRPDSAGPITVHRARVRGDHRLPENRNDPYPRTKLIPPSE